MENEEKDSFEGLGWRAEVAQLADFHVPVNMSPKLR